MSGLNGCDWSEFAFRLLYAQQIDLSYSLDRRLFGTHVWCLVIHGIVAYLCNHHIRLYNVFVLIVNKKFLVKKS